MHRPWLHQSGPVYSEHLPYSHGDIYATDFRSSIP